MAILTDTHDFALLSYDQETKSITTISSGCVKDDAAYAVESKPKILYDGHACYAHLIPGFIKVIPIEQDDSITAYNLQLNQINLIDHCISWNAEHTLFIVLWQETESTRKIEIYTMDLKKETLSSEPKDCFAVDNGAEKLVALPHLFGIFQAI